MLREELLPVLALLWRDAGLREGDFAAVLAMLEETGVLYSSFVSPPPGTMARVAVVRRASAAMATAATAASGG